MSRQSLQGVRYFVFLEIYLITLNVMHVEGERPGIPQRLLQGAVVVTALWFATDAIMFARISAGRSSTFERLAAMDLTKLAGKNGVAYDIGMIGYFTAGHILDVNGLVDGREIASLPASARLERFAGLPVEFVFANPQQLSQINQYIDTSGMASAGQFDFPNLNGTSDAHTLLIRGH